MSKGQNKSAPVKAHSEELINKDDKSNTEQAPLPGSVCTLIFPLAALIIVLTR